MAEVGKEALKKLGITYRVNGDNVTFQEWTNEATVERAMNLSREDWSQIESSGGRD